MLPPKQRRVLSTNWRIDNKLLRSSRSKRKQLLRRNHANITLILQNQAKVADQLKNSTNKGENSCYGEDITHNTQFLKKNYQGVQEKQTVVTAKSREQYSQSSK